MSIAYLILGGNKGKKYQNLLSANNLIEKRIGKIIKQSEIYTTKAWGNTNQPDFLNQVIAVQTNLSPVEILTIILSIEIELGRIRTSQKWQERTMDIDILFYNDEVIKSPNLIIPHPFIQDRKFVLIPLAEIAKDLIHPIFKKNIETLLNECKDDLEVIIASKR